MFNVSISRIIPSTSRGIRHLTQQAATAASSAQAAAVSTSGVKHPYFVARNTRGSLPVYTDIRNGGTRYQVLVRNIDGNVNAMAKELSTTLFPANSEEALRMKVSIVNSRHIILQGGRWKNDVVTWLRERGF